MLRFLRHCCFFFPAFAINYELLPNANCPSLGILEEFLQDLHGPDLEFSIKSIDKHSTHESRPPKPPRFPDTRQISLYDPSTGQLHSFEWVALSDRRAEITDTRTDFIAQLGVTLREVSHAFEVHASVSVDGEGNSALTSFTLPVLPSSLKALWQEPNGVIPHADTIPALLSRFLSIPPRPAAYFDIMSVNIWNYHHWEDRKIVMIEEIRRHSPDVIGFQEVRSRKVSHQNKSRFQVYELAKLLGPGYQFEYHPVMEFAESDSEYVHEGLAIFSKFPILQTTSLLLSRDDKDPDDFHQRTVLRCKLSTPLGNVHFMTTHLSLSPRARKRTLPEIGAWVAGVREPVVLLGDFNAEFRDGDNPLQTEFGFHDAWSLNHPDDAGWTFNSWEPKSRIDYILVNNVDVESISVEGKNGKKWPSPLEAVGGVKSMRQTMFPSDHMFLLARLSPLDSKSGKPKIDL